MTDGAHQHDELVEHQVELHQRLVTLENQVNKLINTTPTPDPDPEPDPPQNVEVLAQSTMKGVPVPLRRNSPHRTVFAPGVAGDHPWGIGGYKVGQESHGYPGVSAKYPVTNTPDGWKIPYEHHMNKSMPIKLKHPVREAWASFTMRLHDNWRWGRTTKIGGFIGPDGRSDFSMRFCVWDWHRTMEPSPGLYYYHVDQAESWGDDVNKRFDLLPGNTYHVKLGCKLNTPGDTDGWGVLQVTNTDTLETVEVTKSGLRWPNSAVISHWYWGHMFGGPWTVWAPEEGFPGPWHMTLSDLLVTDDLH